MAIGITFNVTQGDVKPIAFVNVTSSTKAAITGSTYKLIDHYNPGTIIQSGPMSVSGSTISTPNISWSNDGQFTLQIQVTFADGIVDNSIQAYVFVAAVNT